MFARMKVTLAAALAAWGSVVMAICLDLGREEDAVITGLVTLLGVAALISVR